MMLIQRLYSSCIQLSVVVIGLYAHLPEYLACLLPGPGLPLTLTAYNRGGSSGMANGGGGGGRPGERQQLLELVHLLQKRSMLPVAVFCFSKKR
jgi:hypothetical protein